MLEVLIVSAYYPLYSPSIYCGVMGEDLVGKTICDSSISVHRQHSFEVKTHLVMIAIPNIKLLHLDTGWW